MLAQGTSSSYLQMEERHSLKAPLSVAHTAREIAADPFKAGEIFVSTNQGIWYSANYGSTFVAPPTRRKGGVCQLVLLGVA